jgi:alpha-methylacyl-CoA racemase
MTSDGKASRGAGPLQGLRVIEFAGIGPGPFCGMMLADMGADVILVERPQACAASEHKPTFLDLGRFTVTHRGKRSIALDLKKPEAIEAALKLIESADALIEAFRPGVMERIGLGPDVCLARNRRLVYGRMTGWGQTGPLAQSAGHDLNYAALTGALALGRKGADGAPWLPPTVVGDMAGGAMFLAFGIVCGLMEARRSGSGQVVDAAITDGAAVLGALIHGVAAAGLWPRDNMMQGNAHFYNVYRCADERWISLGPIEPQFYRVLREKLGLADDEWDAQYDPARWPALRTRLEAIFATRTRDEWCALLEGCDACFAPVLELDEASTHPHNLARQAFVTIDGVTQPAPAPRFSRTPGSAGTPPRNGADGEAVLNDFGFDEAAISALRAAGALA